MKAVIVVNETDACGRLRDVTVYGNISSGLKAALRYNHVRVNIEEAPKVLVINGKNELLQRTCDKLEAENAELRSRCAELEEAHESLMRRYKNYQRWHGELVQECENLRFTVNRLSCENEEYPF